MLATVERLAGRRGRCLLVAAVVVGAAGLSAAPALAVPNWHITMEHHNPYGPLGFNPFTEKEGDKGETFARESGGNAYTIKVENSGESTIPAGAATVVDLLPAGIVLGGENEASGTNWNCKILTGGIGAECSRTTETEPLASEPITLHVHVTPQALNPSTNVATVSGGGAEASSTAEEGKTTVTEAVPFGIDRFTTSVVAEQLGSPGSLGSPFSQAGGHPFAASTELVFNYTTTDLEGHLGPAGGAVKDVEVEVPPGFVGNPQNALRCPIESLKGRHCPANTAVGYTSVVLSGVGRIVGGKAETFPAPSQDTSSLVYNLQPGPGTPAQLGFLVAGGLPFVLDAKLRSDGDYGITVGDSAVGEKPTAVRVTLCANGAGGTSPNFSCNAGSASSKPFLTNPTGCASSAPVTTATANLWDEPANYVSKTVYTGTHLVAGKPSETESFVTGCNLLEFHPELEFKPSPASEGGTTQADEPTGMTFNLTLPQSNEAAVNATPELKNLVMTLPAGMTVSPSAADGLQACSNAQFGLGTEFGPGSTHSEPAKPASCPLASQIGAVEVFTPLLSGAPTIEGVPSKGKPLTCSQGAWSGAPALSYQWLRGSKAIGPTGEAKEYVPVAEDEGKALQCQVTATNTGGSSVAVSRDVVALPEPATALPFPPSSIAAPSGTASVGNPLTCVSGAWTGGNVAFAYQWLRGGVPIAGAESEKYTLASEDEGKAIQCQVTGTNAGGTVITDSAAAVSAPAPSTAPPLPGAPLQGQLFVGEPECSPCTESNHDATNGKLFRLFLQVQDPRDGLILKLHGTTSADEKTGQLTATFLEQPQAPFELLQLKLKGGPRAPLANPQSCGPAVSSADLTPWSAPGLGGLSGEEPIPGTPDATLSAQFNVDFNGAGGACPAGLPFNPSFNAGTMGANATTAGTSPSFSLTFSRQDREQNLSGVQVRMPKGLVGKIAGIPLCGAAQADAGTCGPESQIGTTTTGAGPGPHPFFVSGKVYLTGPYKGAPFGLSIVVPAVAGPFNLGNVVVRSAITVDPNTAVVTVTSDPLPQILDGVPFRLREVNADINRSGFMVNPTNCDAQHVSATITALQGASAQVASPFGLGGCTGLPFRPTFTATTQGQTSKTQGASLDVKITYPPGVYANIAKSVTELPIALPSRLTTIQKACVDTVFEANPATCGEGSVIGHAIARTPLLANPLAGPAYLVSHGNRAFPDIEIVLQGEGITVNLDGLTDIKKGITKTTFNSLPDTPISTFELMLPEGPHSALAANVPLCEQPAVNLPTTLTAQNGAVQKQITKIAVTGCSPSVKITKARLQGNALLVTVKTGASARGAVTIRGNGLKTTKKNLTAGTHQIRVAFTKAGITKRKRHKKTIVHVRLTVGKQAVATATTVRL